MPELPDLETYRASLACRILGRPVQSIRVRGPFLLRTAEPPLESARGRAVREIRRMGKRIVFGLEGDLFLVFHLMIAGRFRWAGRGARPPFRITQAEIDFETGRLLLTEAGTKKRAALHLVAGRGRLAAMDPGGIEPMEADLPTFAAVLARENHTLKRVLTDQRLIAGIGNAYSDEILHAARLSPVRLTRRLTVEETTRLHTAARAVLGHWTALLLQQFKDSFPGAGDVTAFRQGFAVHGRYGQPCPDCGTGVQRIRYAENETNYCPRCQTGGRVLADRSLSRLLREDWPATIDELEERSGGRTSI
jgi:formamidopyrimidine-DNA glycosylase